MPKLLQHIIVHYIAYEGIPDDLRWDVMSPNGERQVDIVKEIKKINGYVPVAAIEFDDKISLEANLEHAYKLLQNGLVTDSWTLSPPDGLTALVDPIDHEGSAMGHRSASMGDLFEYGGNHWVVATCGFAKVD